MDIDIMAVMECTEYVLDKMDMRLRFKKLLEIRNLRIKYQKHERLEVSEEK